MMKSNVITLPMSTMLEYAKKNRRHDVHLDWGEILELEKRPPVALIQIHRDDDTSDILASLSWGWQDKEMKLAKITVVDKNDFRKKGIGNALMEMLFSVAKFYECSKITGVIDGKKFLWDWYEKLGFDIYDKNKLLMRFDDA